MGLTAGLTAIAPMDGFLWITCDVWASLSIHAELLPLHTAAESSTFTPPMPGHSQDTNQNKARPQKIIPTRDYLVLTSALLRQHSCCMFATEGCDTLYTHGHDSHLQ
jgi:hypothetical protein